MPSTLCERTVGISSQHIPTGRGRRGIRPRHKFRLVRRNRVLVTSPSFFSDWDFLLSETRLPSLHHWSRISRCLDRSPEMRSWTPPHSCHANTAYRSVCVHAKTVVPPRSVTCSITPVVVPPPAPYRTMSTAETVQSVPQGHPIVNNQPDESRSSEPRDSSSRHPTRRQNRHERRSATDSLRSGQRRCN